MSFVPIMAATSAAAAAARQRQEEEAMTRYSIEDLNADWEFKIVRATAPIFRKAETLRRVVEEEARAGWVLLEKFDDSRLRFKRPRSAAQQDAYLPADVAPYRTSVGSPVSGAVIGTAVGVVVALALGIFLSLDGSATGGGGQVPLIAISVGVVFVLVIVGAVVAVARTRA